MRAVSLACCALRPTEASTDCRLPAISWSVAACSCGALSELVGTRVQLVARRRNRTGHLADLADHLGKLVHHRIDLRGQIAQLVPPFDVGPVVQMSLVKLPRDLDDFQQGAA